jgi:hypothetical protein
MLLTSGDIFFGLITGGMVAIFSGLGLAITHRRRLANTGLLLGAAGVIASVAPMFGAVDAIYRAL